MCFVFCFLVVCDVYVYVYVYVYVRVYVYVYVYVRVCVCVCTCMCMCMCMYVCMCMCMCMCTSVKFGIVSTISVPIFAFYIIISVWFDSTLSLFSIVCTQKCRVCLWVYSVSLLWTPNN